MNIATGRLLFCWTQSFLSVRLSIPVVVTEKAESEGVIAFHGRYSWCGYENCAPLGLYASSSDNFLATFLNSLSYPSSEVILTPEDWTDRLSWPLKMGPICCPDTSLRNYPYSLRNMPEERSCRLLGGGIGVAELGTVALDFVNFLTAVGTLANGSEVTWK